MHPTTPPRSRRLVGLAAGLAALASVTAALPARAQATDTATTTTTTVTTDTPAVTTGPATPRARTTTAARTRRTRANRKNNPSAKPWNPQIGKDAPMGNFPPRVSPGRPAGAISATPTVEADDPGDAGMSQTSPVTPR